MNNIVFCECNVLILHNIIIIKLFRPSKIIKTILSEQSSKLAATKYIILFLPAGNISASFRFRFPKGVCKLTSYRDAVSLWLLDISSCRIACQITFIISTLYVNILIYYKYYLRSV